MRVLILRGGALGDFLVTWPALRALRRQWPHAEIELVGNRRAAELAVLTHDLTRAHSQDEARFAPLFSAATLPATFADWLSQFDLIFNFWPDPDGVIQTHLARPGHKFFSRTATIEARPAAQHFLEMTAKVGASMNPADFRIQPRPEWKREASERLGGPPPRVAFHPGSGSPLKNWPNDRWMTLAEALAEPILAILGEAEHAWPPPDHQSRVRTAREWPLATLTGALSQCRLFIGHDSGISHLAAALGLPCVLLFGPTDPAIWAPPGNHVQVMRKGTNLDAISVADVLGVIQPLLNAT